MGLAPSLRALAGYFLTGLKALFCRGSLLGGGVGGVHLLGVIVGVELIDFLLREDIDELDLLGKLFFFEWKLEEENAVDEAFEVGVLNIVGHDLTVTMHCDQDRPASLAGGRHERLLKAAPFAGVVLDHLSLYGRPEGQGDHGDGGKDRSSPGVAGAEKLRGREDHESCRQDLGKEPEKESHDFLPEITFTQSKRATSCPLFTKL